MLRTIIKFFLWLLAAIMTLVIIGFIAFQVSPRPGAYPHCPHVQWHC